MSKELTRTSPGVRPLSDRSVGVRVTTVFSMGDESTGLAESGWTTLAREFVPLSHRNLPMLRIYLPFRDDDNALVRWSAYVPVEEHSASLNWFEAADSVADQHPAVRDLTSCMGELDQLTADALRDAVGSIQLRCLRWTGYGETPDTDSTTRVFGLDFFAAALTPDDLQPERRVPEFAWDDNARLAWGGRLYPDSLIVAAELPLFRQLRNDPRLDTATVFPDRDVLPASSGD